MPAPSAQRRGRDDTPVGGTAVRYASDGYPDDGHAADGYRDDRHADDGYAARPRGTRDEWVTYDVPPGEVGGGHRGESFARQQARRRRRDTLSVLAAVFVAALLLATVTGATAVWALCGLVGVALASYVAQLAHLRRMAVERERKLHFLDAGEAVVPARGGAPRPYVSGRYAHPSNQRAVAH